VTMRKTTRRVVFHHSLSPEVSAEEIRAWHKARGFDDIGYHYVVHMDGRIDPGRKLESIGAHAAGKNADSVGVCLTGDFRLYPPTQHQVDACKLLFAKLCENYGALAVDFHRPAILPNACPGPCLDRAKFREYLTGE
jgi:N-acetylmuramoyl-L-alanine amidase